MREFDDFEWTSDAELTRQAAQPFPWAHYLHTAVEFDGHGTVYPLDDGAIGGQQPALGPLHVITAIQPDATPDSPDNRARLDVLDRHLADSGIRSVQATGASLDGTHREQSRAVFGLDDLRARELGRQFGQVAVFAWSGPRWSLLACAGDRQAHRGWRWEPR